jgi:hypothetical protein
VLDLANTQLQDDGAEELVKGLGNGHFHRHDHSDARLLQVHRGRGEQRGGRGGGGRGGGVMGGGLGGGRGIHTIGLLYGQGQDVLPELQELVLCCNSLGKRAAAALVRLLGKRLVLLDLKENNLCDEAIAIISAQLLAVQEEAEAAVLDGEGGREGRAGRCAGGLDGSRAGSGLRVLDVAGNPLESGAGGENVLFDMARRLHGCVYSQKSA